MAMESNQHNLVYEEELLEEVEEEEALQRRHSNNCNNYNNKNGNGNVIHYCSTSISNGSNELGAANGDESDSAAKENRETHYGDNNSVYFDQHDGIWKCRHCNWTYCMGSPLVDLNQNIKKYLDMPMNVFVKNHSVQSGMITDISTAIRLSGCLLAGTETVNEVLEMKNDSVTSSTSETNSRDADVQVKDVENQEILIGELNDQCGEILGCRGFANSSLTALEKSHEEQNSKSVSFNNETRVAGDFDLIEEADKEETELDIERVLQKQNTHDLYCPNCNSCITRRVILRRRKPKGRNAHHKSKHNKPDRIFSSKLDVNSATSTKIEARDTVNIHSSDNAAGMADDYNSNRGPEIFRCLSCFSFFIPTGHCFKSFRLFGDSTGIENVQNLRKGPATNRNWLFSIFATDKKKMAIEQAGSEALPDQNSLVSSVSPPVGPVNDLGIASPVVRKEFVKFSTEDGTYLENASTSVGKKSDDATEKVITDASFGPMQAGVNALVSSTCGSLVPDQSQIDKNIRTAMEQNATQNDQASLILGTPLPTKLFADGLNGSTVVGHESRRNMFSSTQGTPVLETLKTGVGETSDAVEKTSQRAQNNDGSTEATSLLQSGTQTYTSEQGGAGISVDILKSIVYGGLIESITSLGVVSSAAGAGSATLNILALGLANLIGGLFIIGHNLNDLKNNHSAGSSRTNEQEDRYQVTLGRRENFSLHATVAIISFLIFGLVPPVIYGFSFYKSDDKDLKLAVVGSVSLVCIILLAIGKAHVQRQPKSYISTIFYFVSIGVMASGASYIVGNLIRHMVEKTGWFEPSLAVPTTVPERKPFQLGRASY
ncbi:conserved hypothetical protein [Ricinus communis]|uniref:Membrane protein of ER body-like protein n=1 Tax=Ricinus communis TaxID=3988 RepID=B9RPK0_RICCO|nr:conserved hypothetical protein [Ricinus communis]